MSHLVNRDEARSITGRVWELEKEGSIDWLVAL